MYLKYLLYRIRMKWELMDQINRNSRARTKRKNRKEYKS